MSHRCRGAAPSERKVTSFTVAAGASKPRNEAPTLSWKCSRLISPSVTTSRPALSCIRIRSEIQARSISAKRAAGSAPRSNASRASRHRAGRNRLPTTSVPISLSAFMAGLFPLSMCIQDACRRRPEAAERAPECFTRVNNANRSGRALEVHAVVKPRHDLGELVRLFAKSKRAGAIDQMELRGALFFSDDLEQHIAGLARRARIVAAPDQLRRNVHALAAHGVPHLALERTDPVVARTRGRVLHCLDRVGVGLALGGSDARAEQRIVD